MENRNLPAIEWQQALSGNQRNPLDHSGPFVVRTFEGFGLSDKNVEFDNLSAALQAFIAASPEKEIPRLLIGNKTVIDLDPENGLIPMFWTDNGKSIESEYFRVATELQTKTATPH